MWMFCYAIAKEGTDEATDAKVRTQFPEAKIVVVGPKKAFAFVKADIDLPTADLLLRAPSALSGSARLCFVTNEDDLVRTIKKNQSCDCPLCRDGGGPEFSMFLKSLGVKREPVS